MKKIKWRALLAALVWMLSGSALATPGVVEFIGPETGDFEVSASAQ